MDQEICTIPWYRNVFSKMKAEIVGNSKTDLKETGGKC
jgi:hypothetical protein